MAMSSISRKEYLRELQKQYRQATRPQRRTLLNGAVAFTGMNRKYLIGVLGSTKTVKSAAPATETRGRKRQYGADFHDALLTCWHAANDICAERLQPFLPELVPRLEAAGELTVTAGIRDLLLAASISTVARQLTRAKRRSIVPLGTTKPGSLLKRQVVVRHGRWDETEPGWLESDTVAHGGDSAKGQFIHTYNFVDIWSGWDELVAAMGMGERTTVQGFDEVRRRFPFAVHGIDSDNGGEYINDHLYRYCKRERLTFTRSRPYKKNDNAHIEQKNWEAVRKIVGYHRLDTAEQLHILNELYQGPLRLYLNYFQPTRKRQLKVVDATTGKKRKAYFEAATPYQRVVRYPHTPQAVRARLQAQYNQLNPVALLAEIRTLVDRLEKTLG